MFPVFKFLFLIYSTLKPLFADTNCILLSLAFVGSLLIRSLVPSPHFLKTRFRYHSCNGIRGQDALQHPFGGWLCMKQVLGKQ